LAVWFLDSVKCDPAPEAPPPALLPSFMTYRSIYS
jgi:hypothetical protein